VEHDVVDDVADDVAYAVADDVVWYRLLARSGLWWCLLAAFTNAFLISGLETVITPITNQSFGFGTLENSCFFGGVAGVALLGAVTSAVLDKWAGCSSPRGRVAAGIVLIWVALVLGVLISHSDDAFTLAHIVLFSAIFIFGLVFLAANNTACFSILLGKRNKGFYMSLLQIGLCVARIVGQVNHQPCHIRRSRPAHTQYSLARGLKIDGPTHFTAPSARHVGASAGVGAGEMQLRRCNLASPFLSVRTLCKMAPVMHTHLRCEPLA
jgi:hypothetical protein